MKSKWATSQLFEFKNFYLHKFILIQKLEIKPGFEFIVTLIGILFQY